MIQLVHFIPPSQRRLALLAAQTDSAPVLITGASGTGKSAIAKWIHSHSPRSIYPFVTAHRREPLVHQIPTAQGGTLLVPEIGEWPLSEQKALLNFLNSRSIPDPAGSNLTTLVNARVITTANQALEGRAMGGLFNSDLLEKLNVFRIEMPPLAKRDAEFSDIVLGIVQEITHELRKEHLKDLTPEAWRRLRSYEWPGNLRELRNVLRIAVLTAPGDVVEESDLPNFGRDRMDFRATREQFEKTYIMELLRAHDWEIDRTCQMTRMPKQQLLSKIDQYGLSRPNPTAPQ